MTRPEHHRASAATRRALYRALAADPTYLPKVTWKHLQVAAELAKRERELREKDWGKKPGKPKKKAA